MFRFLPLCILKPGEFNLIIMGFGNHILIFQKKFLWNSSQWQPSLFNLLMHKNKNSIRFELTCPSQRFLIFWINLKSKILLLLRSLSLKWIRECLFIRFLSCFIKPIEINLFHILCLIIGTKLILTKILYWSSVQYIDCLSKFRCLLFLKN